MGKTRRAKNLSVERRIGAGGIKLSEKVEYYFKLFNNIKDNHEVDFAELELNSLFGHVVRIRNFVDVLSKPPLQFFTNEETRIQDIITYETCYGPVQGFYGHKESIEDITDLVRRLAYIREIYLVLRSNDPENVLRKIFPDGVVGRNVQFFQSGQYTLLRFITNQYFLEKSEYISKLSRNEREVDKNVETLFEFPFKQIYRIPASSTMAVGKRLEDYFAIREEPSLYLTHYMHPYKGKFHPKMVRALLNYIYPKSSGLVMDNFAGSGTLLVEATLMGLDSIGVEIDPLSVLMSNVKCHSLTLDASKLKGEIEKYLKEVETALNSVEMKKVKKSHLKTDIPENVLKLFSEGLVDEFILANEIARKIPDKEIREFILLGLSGTISDLARRKKAKFIDALTWRIAHLYLRVYLFKKLNETLKIKLGKSITYVGDTRDMQKTCRTLDNQQTVIESDTIDADVTSPPYSTALDYIRNDLPQLTILGLVPSMEQLEKDMIGNPRVIYGHKELLKEIETNNPNFQEMPEHAKEVVSKILAAGRTKEALRAYKFFKDMHLSLIEMARVMKRGAKCAVVIGNNHYKLNGEYEEVKNDEVFWKLAEKVGFKKERVITRVLEKSSAGNIRYESIVIIVKK